METTFGKLKIGDLFFFAEDEKTLCKKTNRNKYAFVGQGWDYPAKTNAKVIKPVMGEGIKAVAIGQSMMLKEKSIGTASQTINVVVDIDKTVHAGERQGRHGEDNPITDDEIKKTAERGIPKLSKLLMFDKVRVGDEIVIQAGGGMNVVGAIKQDGDHLKLVVITVMKKKNFKPKPGTTPIKV